jgi:asparagine synthase (glutamine-hydrolysing)
VLGDPGWSDLDRAWEGALGERPTSPSPQVILFSGGVDSGLLAWELRNAPATRLFTIGVPGADDLLRAAAAARPIGREWSSAEVHAADLAEIARRLAPEFVGVPGPRRGIFLALALAMQEAPAGPLLVGQGVDELFLGYAHFRGLEAPAAAARAFRDLALLLQEDWPRTVGIARRLGRTVEAPYLEPGFVAAAAAIPIVKRLPAELTKPWFRRWARHRGLPEAIASTPKRAIQYGSGVDRMSRRAADVEPSARSGAGTVP